MTAGERTPAAAMRPLGIDTELPGFGAPTAVTGAGTPVYLATASAAELIARCPRVAELLPRLVEALATQAADGPSRLFDLTDLSTDELTLIGEVLGGGEVVATAALPDDVVVQIQESVLAGLWRVRFSDGGGRLFADVVEVAAIPAAIERAAETTGRLDGFAPAPTAAMNVMPVLAEIAERARIHVPGRPNHVVNFSLLPMNAADMAHLQETLGAGPVQILSRGYGSCQIVATGVRHVWSVQYFNAADAIVLDTLEIGDVPAAARAAVEDFRDSAERLREIEEAYFR